jgi:hypothetical protein
MARSAAGFEQRLVAGAHRPDPIVEVVAHHILGLVLDRPLEKALLEVGLDR